MTLREQLLPFLDPDNGLAQAAADWLQERAVLPAELLKAYADDLPAWLGATWQEDEALREVLALWCQWTEPEVFRPTKMGGAESLRYRFEAVRACGLTHQDMADEVNRASRPHTVESSWKVTAEDVEQVLRVDGKPYRHVAAGIARARRDQKRRVLSLFPEVEHRRLWRFDLPTSEKELRYRMDEAEARMREGGWRVDVGITVTQDDDDAKEVRYEQTLAAPDWIPPEPSPFWGQSQSTPLEDLRRVQERVAGDLMPTLVVQEAERRGIDMDGAPRRFLQPRVFFGEDDPHRRHFFHCAHAPSPISARMFPGPVEPPAVVVEDVVLEALDFIERLPRGRQRRTRYWLGQCARCRTVYWSERDLGVMPAL
jgi:hypothetical protein